MAKNKVRPTLVSNYIFFSILLIIILPNSKFWQNFDFSKKLFSKYSFLAHQIKTRHVCDSCRTINLKFLKQKHLIKICQNLEWNSFIDTVAYATLTSARELKIICNGKKMNKENYEELIMVRMIRSRELTAGNRTKNTHWVIGVVFHFHWFR